jgi:para-nitrobenzyl esterase
MGPADPEVSTSAGRVRGRIEQGNAVFRGIPFAQPPVGPLRFQAPRPPARWDGVRDAAGFGPQCPQGMLPGGPRTPGAVAPPADTAGEWLTVNVWTPDTGARTLPVMVWIHGGAYMFGAGGPGHDGTLFASAGTVFVSCNYRLGVEGFMLIDGVPANRGLLDAAAALRWVRDNIAAFGGDPANVTVFGESAGAGVIAALLAMNAAKGLFKRAIAQSVPGTFFSAPLAAAVTGAVAAAAGLPATCEALAGADPMRLVAAQLEVAASMKRHQEWGPLRITDTPFSPVVDGEVLARAPWRALVAGAARDVELLTGHNKDEYRLMIAASGRLGQLTGDDADTALGYFAPAPDGAAGYRKVYAGLDPGGLFEVAFSDWLFRMPTLHLAQAHAMSGGTTYLYELTAQAPVGALGACHALDVPLLFGSYGEGIGLMLTGPEPPAEFVMLGDVMRREWVSFAACGNPGWSAYGTEHRTTRVYDLQPDVCSYPEEASMHLWQRHMFDALELP